MKKTFALLIMISLITVCYGQAEDDQETGRTGRDGDMVTLIGKSSSIGGYGGISTLYSQIDSKDAFVFGARGAVIMGHVFAFGIAGAGFINEFQYDIGLDDNVGLAGGYGGLFFEPIIMPRFPVHVSIPVTVGVGGVGLTTYHNHWDNDNVMVDRSDAFFVVEPGIELELNITKFFRFSLGGYYRYTSDINVSDVDLSRSIPKDALRGFSAGATFKFGFF